MLSRHIIDWLNYFSILRIST